MQNIEILQGCQTSHPIISWCIRFIIIIGLICIAYISLMEGVFEPVYYTVKSANWSNIIIRTIMLWAIMGSGLLAFLTVLWFLYRHFQNVNFSQAPFLTVIIPAYNVEGFRRVREEIVITIDSDSVIEKKALLTITGPFHNPKIGAVAGKVAVYNRYEGLISWMLHVRFVLSFDFIRSTQSTCGTVDCCPGALSAYRIKLRDILDAWLWHAFLGKKCTHGENRELTNLILAAGYNAVYQRTAVVHTIVPRTYTKLYKMYLRWNRSHILEEIIFACIVWKRPLADRIIAILDKIITNLCFPVDYASLIMLIILTFNDPMTIVRLLFAMGLISFFNMLYYLHSEYSLDFIFGILYDYFYFFYFSGSFLSLP
jgi:cellulose synthase/poly-beta-1,6-N-acetylglucosamine synthase-like glycosyltransferase